MSKKATKALNNPYYIARYNASKNNPNLTSREKTAEILNIDRTRLSRIELGMSVPYPEEVLGWRMYMRYRSFVICIAQGVCNRS